MAFLIDCNTVRHVPLRHWKESEFYLNYLSSLLIYTEEHTLKGSSKKTRFSAIFIVMCYTVIFLQAHSASEYVQSSIFKFLKCVFLPCVSYPEIRFQILQCNNSVIWCLNLWAPVCNLRNTTRKQSYNGFVWYITGRLSALRWLLAGLNNWKMHSSSENSAEIVGFFFLFLMSMANFCAGFTNESFIFKLVALEN